VANKGHAVFAWKEIAMAKEKDILRMHFEGLSQRDICAALKCGHSKVNGVIVAARNAGLTREAMHDVKDDGSVLLPTPPIKQSKANHAAPDFERLAKELGKPDVTRKLLWYEYCTDLSDGNLVPYQYSQFCKLFDEHLMMTKATYRIKHEPGKRMFVDWAGSLGHITDAITGDMLDVYIFVAEGFMDMKQASWTAAHIHAFENFGGVPAIIVPDNAKTATVRSTIYTTLINPRYDELAAHYSCAVIPARSKRPNDKALVEHGVNVVEKSVLAAFRNRTFFTLQELNEAIARKVEQINAAPFQRRPGSRLEIFKMEEKEHLRPLPHTRFELPVYKTAKVSPDYHVQCETMRYSVPYTLIGKTCELRLTAERVDIMCRKQLVATHKRLYGQKGQYSTFKEHMPATHAAYDAKWTPERYQHWADSIGPATRAVIDRILMSKQIVEQAFVPCMNILGLARKGRRSLVEEACMSLAEFGQIPTYSLVKNTMDAIKAKRRATSTLAAGLRNDHPDTLGDAGYVRGSDYYGTGKGDDDDIR
jgi:transposase